MKRLIFLILLFISVFGFSQTNAPLFFGVQNVSGIPTDSLVAYYPFNGNANDESGNGNNGTVNGATLTTDRNGVSNTAYSFDGSNWIDIGNALDFSGTNYLSVSLWIYYTGSDGLLIGRDSGSLPNRQWAVYVSGSRFSLFARDAGGFNVVAQSSILVTDNWYHGVAQFESGIAKIYINNINDNPVQTNILLNFNNLIINNDIGRRPDGTFFHTGKIDDIRIYNRTLTTDEITLLYNE